MMRLSCSALRVLIHNSPCVAAKKEPGPKKEAAPKKEDEPPRIDMLDIRVGKIVKVTCGAVREPLAVLCCCCYARACGTHTRKHVGKRDSVY